MTTRWERITADPEWHERRKLARRQRYAKNPAHYAARAAAQFQKHKTRRYAKGANRRRHLERATPVWANLDLIQEFYELAQRKTEETGIKHEVDHEIPLHSRKDCGLHVETNLRVITKRANIQKGNFFKGADENE